MRSDVFRGFGIFSGCSKVFTDVLETFSDALDVPKIYP